MRATQLAHKYLRKAVQAGDICLDATLGNGNDALFLASLVGDDGHVHAFDVQPQALETSEVRLRAAGFSKRVTLHLRGHEEMAEVVGGPLRAVMFNLGYLPGSNQAVITRTETTMRALDLALALLASGGLLSIVCYPGHAGGDEEASAVFSWTHENAGSHFQILESPAKKSEGVGVCPFLILIQKE